MATLTPDQRKAARYAIIQCVLATDLSKGGTFTTAFKAKINAPASSGAGAAGGSTGSGTAASRSSNAPHFGESDEDKLLTMQMMIKCADVSHPARALRVHEEWSARVSEEFYRQGDAEKALGLPISPLCDRTAHNLAKSQIGFIEFVVRPPFGLLTSFCEVETWMEGLKSNLKHWKELAASDNGTGGAQPAAASTAVVPAQPQPASSATSPPAATARADANSNMKTPTFRDRALSNAGATLGTGSSSNNNAGVGGGLLARTPTAAGPHGGAVSSGRSGSIAPLPTTGGAKAGGASAAAAVTASPSSGIATPVTTGSNRRASLTHADTSYTLGGATVVTVVSRSARGSTAGSGAGNQRGNQQVDSESSSGGPTTRMSSPVSGYKADSSVNSHDKQKGGVNNGSNQLNISSSTVVVQSSPDGDGDSDGSFWKLGRLPLSATKRKAAMAAAAAAAAAASGAINTAGVADDGGNASPIVEPEPLTAVSGIASSARSPRRRSVSEANILLAADVAARRISLAVVAEEGGSGSGSGIANDGHGGGGSGAIGSVAGGGHSPNDSSQGPASGASLGVLRHSRSAADVKPHHNHHGDGAAGGDARNADVADYSNLNSPVASFRRTHSRTGSDVGRDNGEYRSIGGGGVAADVSPRRNSAAVVASAAAALMASGTRAGNVLMDEGVDVYVDDGDSDEEDDKDKEHHHNNNLAGQAHAQQQAKAATSAAPASHPTALPSDGNISDVAPLPTHLPLPSRGSASNLMAGVATTGGGGSGRDSVDSASGAGQPRQLQPTSSRRNMTKRVSWRDEFTEHKEALAQSQEGQSADGAGSSGAVALAASAPVAGDGHLHDLAVPHGHLHPHALHGDHNIVQPSATNPSGAVVSSGRTLSRVGSERSLRQRFIVAVANAGGHLLLPQPVTIETAAPTASDASGAGAPGDAAFGAGSVSELTISSLSMEDVAALPVPLLMRIAAMSRLDMALGIAVQV